MRKSNTLMIAYILFLIISVVVCAILKSDKIVAISAAATMAGYLFATADSAYQISNTIKRYSADTNDLVEVCAENVKIDKAFCQKLSSEYEEAIKLLLPYRKADEKIDELLRDYESNLREVQNELLSIEETVDAIEDTNQYIFNENKSAKKYEKTGNVLMIAGFLLFFIIAIFEQAERLIIESINTYTICAFALVMSNYYVKDYVDERYENSFSKKKHYIEKTKEISSNIKATIKSIDIVEKTKDLLLSLDAQEEITDGQTEDADGE